MRQARIRILCLMLSDCAGLAAVLLLCAAAYRNLGEQYDLRLYWNLWPMLPVFCVSAGIIRLYHGGFFYPGIPLASVEELRRMTFAVTLAYLLLFAFLTLTRRAEAYSRLVLLVSWILSVGMLIPLRGLVRSLMKHFGIGQVPILIAGGGHAGITLAEYLRNSSYYGFEPAGFLDDAPDVNRVGTLDDAVRIGREKRIAVLFCCVPFEVVQKHLRDYMRYFSHVSIFTDARWFPISWAYPVNVKGLPGIELSNQLLQPGPRLFKASFESVLAATGILLLWPLFLLLMLLVKCSSPGPVFYRAARLGQNGRPIRVWKFRTMYVGADRELERLLAEDPELATEWRVKFKLSEDPRITPLGRFLRKTSLDELPQLFNVLRGEMAMIGPRPIVEAEKACYGNEYEVFSRVKPGITGLWQVSGRSEVRYDNRVMLDLFYVFNWSVWLDLYILALTVWEVIRCRGAK